MLHRVRERLREQEHALRRSAATSSTAATRLATSVAVRQGRISASGAVSGASKRALVFATPACASFIHAQVRASPSSSETCGPPAELALGQRRVEHRALHVAEPRLLVLRLRVEPATRAQRRAAPRPRLARRCRRCRRPAARPRPRAARDDVADVDEVAALAAVAEDRRLLAARHPLEEDRDDAALEPGVLPRPVDVREAQRDVRGAVDAVPAGEVLLAALLRDPVRRERRNGDVLVGRAGALAVDRPAGRGEDRPARPARRARARSPCRRRSRPRRSSGRFIDVCTSACAARWKTTSASAANGVADVVLERASPPRSGSRACRTRSCRRR